MNEQTARIFDLANEAVAIVRDSDNFDVTEFSDRIDLERAEESPRSLDQQDRAFIYGLAFGLVVGEDRTYDAEVRQLVYDVAEETWRRWNSVPTRRELREESQSRPQVVGG